MENTNTRVLAYQLAQTIPDDLLHDISGGAPGAIGTFRITGALNSTDAEFDFDARF